MSRRNENWLLVEWGSGGREVVYSKAVVHPVNRELKTGDKLTVSRRGDPQPATLIARASKSISLQLYLPVRNESKYLAEYDQSTH